jgi:hypothetical protein
MAGCVTRADRSHIDRKHYLRWLKSFFRLEIEQLANDRKVTTKLSAHEGILEYCYRR